MREEGIMQGMREPVLTITGRFCFQAENYRHLVEVSSERILIQARNTRIAVCGEALQVEYYAREELQIRGTICRVEFL